MIRKKLLSKIVITVLTATFIFGDTIPRESVMAKESSDGLVAHWAFDNNYQETVNKLTTNLGGKELTYIEGIFGQAAVFNGKDNYLTVLADPVLNFGNSRNENNDNFTISAWLNLGDTQNQYIGYLLDKGNDIGYSNKIKYTNPYALMFNGAKPYVYLSNLFNDNNQETKYSTSGKAQLDGSAVEGEEWFLFTITYDGKTIKSYRNNELLMQKNYTDGITFNDEDLFIGVNHELKNYFKGAVDDLRFYTRTFSYDDVNAAYQEGVSANQKLVEPKKQLVAYYSFDGNLKDGSVFKNDGESVAMKGTSKYVIGKNGKAISISKGSYIRVPSKDQLNFDTEFTVSLWLKLDNAGTYPLLYRLNPAIGNENNNDYTYNLSVKSWGNNNNNTKLMLQTKAYNSDYWSTKKGPALTGAFTYTENKVQATSWLHYTYTYKAGELNFYLNGKLIETKKFSDDLNICNASGDLLIGYDNKTFLNGAIDELKLYNKCLTQKEVAVEAKRVDTIKLSKSDSKLLSCIAKGKTITIKSVILNDIDLKKSSEIKSKDKNVTFTSSNKAIFTVTRDGIIKTVKKGKANLTITYGGISETYKVVVE